MHSSNPVFSWLRFFQNDQSGIKCYFWIAVSAIILVAYTLQIQNSSHPLLKSVAVQSLPKQIEVAQATTTKRPQPSHNLPKAENQTPTIPARSASQTTSQISKDTQKNQNRQISGGKIGAIAVGIVAIAGLTFIGAPVALAVAAGLAIGTVATAVLQFTN